MRGGAPKRRAEQGAAGAQGARGGARDGVDAAALARMTRDQLLALATRLREEGDEDVPSSRRWDAARGKRARLDPDAYRTVLAAHLGIDLSGVQHAGAEARSRDHSEEMLDALAGHVAEHDCVPPQKGSALGK